MSQQPADAMIIGRIPAHSRIIDVRDGHVIYVTEDGIEQRLALTAGASSIVRECKRD